MNLKQLTEKCRSYRRFHENKKIDKQTLVELVDLARLSATAANMQPLKFMLSYVPRTNELIFPSLAWAGYLKNWPGPKEGERPSAYIVILHDTQITDKCFDYDCAIAAHSILLGAAEKGLGGCMIAAFKKDALKLNLRIQDRYKILLVVALGKSREQVVIETVKDNNIEYYRDNKDIHHVPKRKISEVIIDNTN